jgi:DNA processing protein
MSPPAEITPQLQAAARWLALSRRPELRPSALARLFHRYGNSKEIFAALAKDPSSLGLGPEAISLLEESVLIAKQLQDFSSRGMAVIPREDAAYPLSLLDLRVPPAVIFLQGDLLPRDGKAIAIVGTRTPTAKGLQLAREFSRQAVTAGFCVVSGLARGIDTAAHQAALAAGGRTIAVLGNGLLKLYPPENKSLANRIARQGTLLSELWPETPVSPKALLARDRLQAALARAVVVVQSHLSCGSLTTARYAISCRRPLFAVPWEEEPFCIGSARLRETGARLLPPQDFSEVLKAASSPLPETQFVD